MRRTMKGILYSLMLGSLLLAASGAVGAVEWKNLDAEHHLGGRKASVGYLQGKVVLVCRWSPDDAESREMLMRMEELWQSFKTKPFVLLAGSCEGREPVEGAKKAVADGALTFPIYAGASLGVGEPKFKRAPFLYVVDETGKVVYLGRNDRTATQVLVSSLTDLEAPKDLKQWQRFLDFELETLPGRAYLRADEFRKKYPAEAKTYYEKFKALTATPDVKSLSELVAFARKAKDMQAFDAKKAVQRQKFEKMIESAISKYGSLVESKDPRVVQEAKNALADLKWTRAAL